MSQRSTTQMTDAGALVLVFGSGLQFFPVIIGTIATCLACVWYTIEIITWRTERLAKQRAERVKEREALARIEHPAPEAAPVSVTVNVPDQKNG